MSSVEQEQRIEAILARHTPKNRSDELGNRELSVADRLQLMSIELCRLQVIVNSRSKKKMYEN